MCWRVSPKMCRRCSIISIKVDHIETYFVVLSYVSTGNVNPSLHVVSDWFVIEEKEDLQKSFTVPGLD